MVDEAMAEQTKEEIQKPFEVFIDENWDYLDKDNRYSIGRYSSYDEALGVAKSIVDGCLSKYIDQGKSADEALLNWSLHGEDPVIRPQPPGGIEHFSARNYARQRAADIIDGLTRAEPYQIRRRKKPRILWKPVSDYSLQSDVRFDATESPKQDEYLESVPSNWWCSGEARIFWTILTLIVALGILLYYMVHVHSGLERETKQEEIVLPSSVAIGGLLRPIAASLHDGTCHMFLFC